MWGFRGFLGFVLGKGEGVGLAEFEEGVSVGSGVGVGPVTPFSRKLSAPDPASATTTAATERITPIAMA